MQCFSEQVNMRGLANEIGFLRKYGACVGNLNPAMGARNQEGIGLSYRPASLCNLATQFQTRFLESIPRPIAGLEFSTLISFSGVMSKSHPD
jgi:hypothetical protein